MGRRADPPALQAAKGSPGKRQTKADKILARAQRVAEMLVAVPMGERVEPPAAFREPRYAGALKVWQELGPELEKTSRLQPVHRQLFAMFCVYLAEWWAACDDVSANGHTQKVKTIAGGTMERLRPILKVREIAFDRAQDAAQAFGLTPREEYALFKDQGIVARENPGLFGGRLPTSEQPTAPAESTPAAAAIGIGGLGRFKSEPPPLAN